MFITQSHVTLALESLRLAQETIKLESQCWQLLLSNQQGLIRSMIDNGYKWAEAKREFDALSAAHQNTMIELWKDLYWKSWNYNALQKRYLASPSP